MEKYNLERLPSNPIEAKEELIKESYERFGKDAITLIKEILGKQGQVLRLKIKKELPDTKLSIVTKAFTQSYDSQRVKVIAITDEKLQIQGSICPFALKDKKTELCEVIMEIDYEYFLKAVSDKIRLKIIKYVAEGDSCWDKVYELKEI